jgi:hypothetical protein
MCKVHWNQYTAGLARDAKARKAAAAMEPVATEDQPEAARSSRSAPSRKGRAAVAAVADEPPTEAEG